MSLKTATKLLLGKCLPSIKEKATKVAITKMDYDENLHMYFRKVESVFAHDPDGICKTGDIVLIEKLPQKLSKLISFKVLKVVYPLGDLIDPISGKKAAAMQFREDIVDATELVGKNPNAFEYEKAPPRGWQEGKKDFSDKETYYKYHDDGSDQPYAF